MTQINGFNELSVMATKTEVIIAYRVIILTSYDPTNPFPCRNHVQYIQTK